MTCYGIWWRASNAFLPQFAKTTLKLLTNNINTTRHTNTHIAMHTLTRRLSSIFCHISDGFSTTCFSRLPSLLFLSILPLHTSTSPAYARECVCMWVLVWKTSSTAQISRNEHTIDDNAGVFVRLATKASVNGRTIKNVQFSFQPDKMAHISLKRK